MNLLTNQSPPSLPNGRLEAKRNSREARIRTTTPPKPEFKEERLENQTSFDAGIVALKILAGALISRIQSLEAGERPTVLNLQSEVHCFEAEMIRMALLETGGRQRRAAKLLGLKATTLSTKIKRHRIVTDLPSTAVETLPEDPIIDPTIPHS